MKHLISNFGIFNESVSRENIEIKMGLSDDEFTEACKLCSEELSAELEDVSAEDIFEDLHGNAEPKHSVIAIDRTTKELLGALCCKVQNIDQSLAEYPDGEVEYIGNIDDYNGKSGIEGCALSVKEEHRNGFVVFNILNTLKGLEYDYVIIQQFESLKSNINYLNKGCKKFCKLKTPEFEEAIDFYIKEF